MGSRTDEDSLFLFSEKSVFYRTNLRKTPSTYVLGTQGSFVHTYSIQYTFCNEVLQNLKLVPYEGTPIFFVRVTLPADQNERMNN